MKKTESAKELRRKAEEKIASQPVFNGEIDSKRLLHELQVHQVELEMQNEELRQTQNNLAESRDHYADLFDFAPIGYVTLDSKGMITSANLTVATFLRVERSQLVGQWFMQFIVAVSLPAFADFLEMIFLNPGKQTCELSLSIEGRDSCFIQVEASAIDSGESCRAAIVDITEHKENETILTLAKEAADVASKAKSAFLANTSHEIRTPLTGILGWIELALTTKLLPDQRHYLEMAQSASGILKTVLDDVLDFSKIEAQKFELNMDPFPLRSSVLTAVELLTRTGAEKGLTVSLDIATEVPEVVIGDEGRLTQILINLLSNAIKFTQQGVIEVRVTKEAKDPDFPERSNVRFLVFDTGIGIPADKMDRLFKSFSQVDSSTTRNYGGTGLGLAVSKGIVEAMGGSIQAQSKYGRGSEFSFIIPFEVHKMPLPMGKKSSSVNQHDEKIGSLRILLAEDDSSNAHLIKQILKQKACDVVIASNGQEAVEIWGSDAFDLILMDVQMAGRNGLDATRAIRKQEESTGAHIPILALTAHAGKENIAQCLDAGMDGYLSKPINTESLYSAIALNTRRGSSQDKIDNSGPAGVP